MNVHRPLQELAGLPFENGAPVFDAPWQARSFAMTLQLYEAGLFTWSEWADTLSGNIARYELTHPVQGSDDYYTLWQTSLEEILVNKGLMFEQRVDPE